MSTLEELRQQVGKNKQAALQADKLATAAWAAHKRAVDELAAAEQADSQERSVTALEQAQAAAKESAQEAAQAKQKVADLEARVAQLEKAQVQDEDAEDEAE